MLKKILTNKLLIIFFVILMIALAIIAFLIRRPSAEQPNTNIYTKEEHIDALSFTQTERIAVRDVYENAYDELQKNIPPDADFTISFDPNGPLLTVRLPAKTLQEFYDEKQTIGLFLIRFNVNPCVPPISIGISWEAQDWSTIKPDQNAQDHSCDKITSFYEELKSINPLIQYLPYTIDGFGIYYTVTESSTLKASYIVNINIPMGLSAQLETRQEIFDELQRQESLALDWIRSKGFDPATLDIRMPKLDINQIQTP